MLDKEKHKIFSTEEYLVYLLLKKKAEINIKTNKQTKNWLFKPAVILQVFVAEHINTTVC